MSPAAAARSRSSATAGEAATVASVVVGRGRQRAQHELVLGAHPQRGPARRHDDEVGTARDEVGEHRRRPGELLEVVEHQQARAGRGGGRRARRAGRRRRPRAGRARRRPSARRGPAPAPPRGRRRGRHRGTAAASRWSTSIARRVLPTPPGPVMVTRRCVPERHEGPELVELGLAADERVVGDAAGRAGETPSAGCRLPGDADCRAHRHPTCADLRGRRRRGGGRRRRDHLAGPAGADPTRGTASRLGTAATRAARSSSSRARPSASERTVCG